MNKNQLATVNGIAALGIGIIILGLGLLFVDMNNVNEVCKPNMFSGQICTKESASLRGVFIAAFGFIIMVAVTLAHGSLSKKNAQP